MLARIPSAASREARRTVNNLRRYWIVFEGAGRFRLGLGYGCGVTAIDREDAIRLIEQKIFKGKIRPLPITGVTEDVDVSTLNAGHVLPNMLPADRRGIWFPMGYD